MQNKRKALVCCKNKSTFRGKNMSKSSTVHYIKEKNTVQRIASTWNRGEDTRKLLDSTWNRGEDTRKLLDDRRVGAGLVQQGLETFTEQARMLVLNSFRGHLTERAKHSLREDSDLLVMPGGLTKLFRPLEVVVNKTFKTAFRRQYNKCMTTAKHYAPLQNVCMWIFLAA
ncbi:hypothetical protein PR048_004218 [Dryococelus australis]|uniref:DDE-1 domain-containing protein n=1 Tax=Dryococelus australis TaxID=614101 RepID=A0ABQ9I4X6_9NEOP|nr:hypothetical protein PR048_004218 [Dryococelus australis]